MANLSHFEKRPRKKPADKSKKTQKKLKTNQKKLKNKLKKNQKTSADAPLDSFVFVAPQRVNFHVTCPITRKLLFNYALQSGCSAASAAFGAIAADAFRKMFKKNSKKITQKGVFWSDFWLSF